MCAMTEFCNRVFLFFFPVKAFAFDPTSSGRLHWYGLRNKTFFFFFFLKFTQLCSYCLLSSLYGRLDGSGC